MWRSEMTASNCWRCKVAKASWPLLAVVHWKAGGPRMRERSLQAAGSSSTARTRAARRRPDVPSASTRRAWSLLVISDAHVTPLPQHPRSRLLYELAAIMSKGDIIRTCVGYFGLSHIGLLGGGEIDFYNGICGKLRSAGTQKATQAYIFSRRDSLKLSSLTVCPSQAQSDL